MLMLSRLPLPTKPSVVLTPPETIHLMEHLSMVPVSAAQIWKLTDRHPLLAKVKCFVQRSWPDHVVQELTEFTGWLLAVGQQDHCST